MNLLYIEHEDILKDIFEIAADGRGIQVEKRYLPAEVYRDAPFSFADEEGLVTLLQGRDGVVLDWTTFGFSKVRGGQGSQLLRYLQAIQESGYQGKIVITTTSDRGVREEVGRIIPSARVFEKPFDLDDLFKVLQEERR
ncbi:hypothetical protein HYT52_02025 [Candidatus Woesearchaeota archaeon]|nr:hypothetical protein [Candidatus Woesearchaeota archaeon]